MKSLLEKYTDKVSHHLAIKVGVRPAQTLCTFDTMVHYLLEDMPPEKVAEELSLQVVEI
jgi:hypothetical protein